MKSGAVYVALPAFIRTPPSSLSARHPLAEWKSDSPAERFFTFKAERIESSQSGTLYDARSEYVGSSQPGRWWSYRALTDDWSRHRSGLALVSEKVRLTSVHDLSVERNVFCDHRSQPVWLSDCCHVIVRIVPAYREVAIVSLNIKLRRAALFP